MSKIRCAIIGSGNIGTDLIYKLHRSTTLEPAWMVGIDPESDGLKRARDLGLRTTDAGVDGLLPHVAEDDIRIAFDATSAYVHAENSEKLNRLGVIMIDLTPAAIGPFCCPTVNLSEYAGQGLNNVNMISCAGQATIPLIHAVSRIQPVDYAEIVATASSKSIGPGTRANLDEFTFATSTAIARVGGVKQGKALIVINPAEPPVMMRDSIFCLTETAPDQDRIKASILEMMEEVQKYVPGYTLVNGPVFDGNKVSTFVKVEGVGDYLPKYAGNLDIMTAAATRAAEIFSEDMLTVSASTFREIAQ